MNFTNTNQNISIYFKEIRNFSNLTREDEINLFGRISKGDKSAETEIFNRLSKLAVNIAKTYTASADLLEDLIQEANIGILDAIKKYDINMGYRFSSYARFWMKAYIGRFLDQMGVVHHCSANVINLANKIREKFYRENQREISEYELLDLLEEQGEVVNDVAAIIDIKLTRIDLPVAEGDDLTQKEYGEFADRTASVNEFESDMDDESLSSDVEKLLNKLTDKEKKYVKMMFGIGQEYEMTYKQIAEAEGCTQERVRQIITGALKKLK